MYCCYRSYQWQKKTLSNNMAGNFSMFCSADLLIYVEKTALAVMTMERVLCKYLSNSVDTIQVNPYMYR